MTYTNAILVGLVQGLTEFLPVSSSGHLLIVQHLFGVNADSVLIFTVLLHIGTLVSVFFCYWKDLLALFKELFLTIIDLVTGKGLRLNERPVRRLGIMIIIASIPTGIIGLAFNDLFESFYTTLLPTGVGLLITGVLLWTAESKRNNKVKAEGMEWTHALVIGTMQGVAICPGISRSGSTLVGGLLTGLERDFAVEFAFLISIPSILGSLIVMLGSEDASLILDANRGPIIAGAVVAAISGIVAIKAMIAVVRKLSLRYFSYYVWVLGIILIIYTLKG
ncbi:MAG: undecaprenyl-diphosphate phosphatase [Clostridiales bacterium]|nr:undecaprenyl-diphosphate phosphatase [Clostridiales bacterium]